MSDDKKAEAQMAKNIEAAKRIAAADATAQAMLASQKKGKK